MRPQALEHSAPESEQLLHHRMEARSVQLLAQVVPSAILKQQEPMPYTPQQPVLQQRQAQAFPKQRVQESPLQLPPSPLPQHWLLPPL